MARVRIDSDTAQHLGPGRASAGLRLHSLSGKHNDHWHDHDHSTTTSMMIIRVTRPSRRIGPADPPARLVQDRDSGLPVPRQ